MLNEYSAGNVSFRQIPGQEKVSLKIGGIPLILQRETWDNITRVADKVGTFRVFLDCNGLECASRCLENKDKLGIGQEFTLNDGTWTLDWGTVEIDNDTAKAIPVLAEKALERKERKGFALFNDSVIHVRSVILSAPNEYGEEEEHEIWLPTTRSEEEIEQYKQEWAKQVEEAEEEIEKTAELFAKALEEEAIEEPEQGTENASSPLVVVQS